MFSNPREWWVVAVVFCIVAWCSRSSTNRVTAGTLTAQEDSSAENDTPSEFGSGGAGSGTSSTLKMPWSEKQELEDEIEDLKRQVMQSKKAAGTKAAAVRPTDPTGGAGDGGVHSVGHHSDVEDHRFAHGST